MESGPKVLIFNFVMDPLDPLLSHQYEAVLRLAPYFEKVTVLTGKIGAISLPSNVRVISTEWLPGKNLSNITKFYTRCLAIVLSRNYSSVFYHMTDLQCLLMAPLIRVLRKKQYLWYAHTTKSRYLSFASYWVNGIVTSTAGSCPVKNNKVLVIGQAIDSLRFQPLDFRKLKFQNLVHIGRLDRSKNIELLISSVTELRKLFKNLHFDIVGSPSSSVSKIWSERVIEDSEEMVNQGWLRFIPAIARSEVPTIMKGYGCFIHAYQGSLDKTIVEATMLRVPVVTINAEYLGVFGSWSGERNPNLVAEYTSFRAKGVDQVRLELERRLEIALQMHSMENWVTQMRLLLK